TSGTVGVWARDRGAKYWDSLRVARATLLLEDYDAAQWTDVGSRQPRLADDSLFELRDLRDNPHRWVDVADYPVLSRPLGLGALAFDGQVNGRREYLGRSWDDGARPELSAFTVEAWVNLSADGERPLVSMHDGDRRLWFAVVAAGGQH